jgi:aspartyl/asparaginyl-tRNA synthetase
MRISSGVSYLFREALHKDGFIEIHSPKLISGESEGGADVFRTDYFGQVCNCLIIDSFKLNKSHNLLERWPA